MFGPVTSYFFHSLSSAPDIMNGNNAVVGRTEETKKGNEVSMEVDLRSKEENKRTLRFAVNGKVQKCCLTRVPNTVRFGVWISFYASFLLTLSFLISFLWLFSPLLGYSIRFPYMIKMSKSNFYHCQNCQNQV